MQRDRMKPKETDVSKDATVSQKGQVVLPPVTVPENIKLEPGDKIEVVWEDEEKK